ncbi:sporulation integral membrane protein YtvI [Thermoactinomyces sp. DSM 45891]|uniref:sporulation integral membrane protein YtvI n=1 Tax=Thermoactinomyces sp. DSM 45891 TaxID=1761907 RepID=UPI0009213554|nr:sporulation integral membrane protein YtvI [Thermoactinomyces sp. DSM 45891]SFX59534.1 sporulation integral membrane protein YtvI [Thermoactinomyces sp. DSM 45891]
MGLRSLVVLLILIGVYLTLTYSLPLVYPFLIAWLIAIFLEPSIRWLERRIRLPRWAGVLIMLIFLLSIVISTIIFLVAELVQELAKLADFLPKILNQFGQQLLDPFSRDGSSMNKIVETIQTYLAKNPTHQKGIEDSIRENLGVVTVKITQTITDILSGIGTFLSNLPFLLTVLVFVTLATFFISLDLHKIKNRSTKFIPVKVRSAGGLVFEDIRKALFGFVRAQVTLISISGLIMLVGLLILGVKYPFTLAVVITIVDLLPYLGVGAVVIPWIIYLLLIGDVELAIGLSVVYAIIVITRQILEPKLVASNVGLDPLLTLIALFVGLQLFGFTGLIIGPVVTVVMLALYRARVFQDVYHYIVAPLNQTHKQPSP